ncbi:MAG: LytTR family DNA-binding domain-containing protein [Oscillospiraceae bacterium]|nr:LytTR family DNA-binding domain-containing protein [Oscillospiraceae bacterium]
MLSLFVYNHDKERATDFSSRCDSYIKSSGKKIFVGSCFNDEKKTADILYSLEDEAVFMLHRDGSLEKISDSINNSENHNYIVLILSTPEEMFDAVNPSVKPSGILLESFDENRIGRIIDEIYTDYMRNHNTSGGEYSFRIRGITYSAAFSDIMMIEVQSKRVTFHTESQTYEFYDSLDAVMKEAPDCFVRIHRSIVINGNYIKSIDFNTREIVLNDDSKLFFSRNYIQEVRSWSIRG